MSSYDIQPVTILGAHEQLLALAVHGLATAHLPVFLERVVIVFGSEATPQVRLEVIVFGSQTGFDVCSRLIA